ncbi:hypothetical protein V6N11_070627 [Hibiscus sabdariffa]|uniref:BED-type domain-containing protein n=1 Tax=Hibiscus sabdariffa TaxID=183260 RepID=A0ABR2QFL5_9ROSI
MSMTGENNDDKDMISSSAESSKERGKTKVVETETPINTKNKRNGKKIVEASTNKGGKKKKVSSAWDHFKTIEGDKEYAECIYCARKISCASANVTYAMKRHIARCKKAPFNLEKTQTILDFESKTKCNADGTIETFLILDTLTSLFDFYASSQPSAPQMKPRSMDDVGHGDGGIRKFKGTNLRKDFVTEIELFDTSETTELDKLVEALICTQYWIRASHDTIMIEESLLALENIEEEMQDLTSEQPKIIIDETNEVTDVTYEEPCP